MSLRIGSIVTILTCEDEEVGIDYIGKNGTVTSFEDDGELVEVDFKDGTKWWFGLGEICLT